MADDTRPRTPALQGHRERAVDMLCGHFAADRLTIEEFERRVDAAHRAATVEELDALTRDLVVLEQASPAKPPAPPVPEPEPRQLLFALLGGVERMGRWRPARQVTVFTFMGGADLDFREAQLPPGETEVFVFCVMGGAHIIVPPDLDVDANGVAIMGGFEHRSPPGPQRRAESPLLKIRGFCIMGGVDIETRLPGETAKQAKLRRRAEQRRLPRER
jgi:hypothetical protein